MRVVRTFWLAIVLAWVVLMGVAQAQVTFTYLAGQEIPTIDPAKHTDETSLHGVINLYDPLIYPRVSQGSMAPGPHVAESWRVDPDGRTYTFKIRRGIKFHDGTELTADDVVFSMQRMLALKKGFSWLWLNLLDPKDVRALDRNTVQFRLSQPFAPFLSTLTQLFVVNKKLVLANKKAGPYGDNGDYGEAYLTNAAAGSGPFQLSSYERSTILELKRFPDYWRGWKPGQIERVVYRVVKEEATMRTLLTGGQADMIDQWRTPVTYEQLAKAPGVVVDEKPSAQLFHIQMNTQRTPLNNIHVRKAIAMAFDYDTAIKQIFRGAIQARGPVPLAAWESYDISSKDLDKYGIVAYKYDLEGAKKELQLSGFMPGQIQLNYVFPEGGNLQRQAGLLLQSRLNQLGIKLNLQELPWVRIVEMSASEASTPDLAAIYDTLKYPHPDSHTYGMYHPSAWGSYRTISRYSYPVVTALLERARRATDPEKQMELYLQATGLVVKDYPSIYVANPMHRIALRDNVKGYRYVGLLGYDVAFYDFTVSR